MSRVKVEGRQINETIRGRDLHVRPLTVDLMAQVGVRHWGRWGRWGRGGAVYVKYSPMGLFERDKGPVINPVSVGVMWHF